MSNTMTAHTTKQLPITMVGLLVPVAIELPLLLFARLIWGPLWAVDLTRAYVTFAISSVIGFAFIAKRLRLWQAVAIAPLYFPVVVALLGILMVVVHFMLGGESF